MSILNIFTFAFGINKHQPVASRQTHTVSGRKEFNLGTAACTLRASSGTAWVTANGQDHIQRAGQSLTLGARKHAAVLSSANGKPVVVDSRN